MSNAEGTAARFTQTHWTVVIAAARIGADGADVAMEELCRRYWYPVSAFVRRQGRKRIVTASEDKTARVWDVENRESLTPVLMHSDPVVFAQFSPDGTRILTLSMDEIVRVWDALTGQKFVELPKFGGVSSAEFNADRSRITTISWAGALRIWDAARGQPISDAFDPSGFVASAPSRDGQQVVIGDWDTVRVWSAQNHQPLTEALKHDSKVISVEFSWNGKQIVTVSDRLVQVWDVEQLLGTFILRTRPKSNRRSSDCCAGEATFAHDWVRGAKRQQISDRCWRTIPAIPLTGR